MMNKNCSTGKRKQGTINQLSKTVYLNNRRKKTPPNNGLLGKNLIIPCTIRSDQLLGLLMFKVKDKKHHMLSYPKFNVTKIRWK